MYNILERVRGNILSAKHTRFTDHYEVHNDDVVSGVTFCVKYMGSCLVNQSSGQEVIEEAVKTVVTMANKSSKMKPEVNLTISPSKIMMMELNSVETALDFPIHRVSYCSSDSTHHNLFSF